MDFSELREAFVLHLQGLRRGRGTLRSFRLGANDFADFCQALGVHQPDQVEEEHFWAWVAKRKRELSQTTIYTRQRQVRTWFAWAFLRGHLLMNPLKNLAPIAHPPHLIKGAPSEAQVLLLLQAPPEDTMIGRRDRALMEFLYGTGLRVAECSAVDVEDLDLQEAFVQVRQGKGGLQRKVPMGPNLARVLADYLENVRPTFHPRDSALWVTTRGKRIGDPTLSILVSRWGREAGLGRFRPHRLRHAYATHMLRYGAPTVALMRLLGHQTLAMVTRYTQLVPEDLKAELFRTHPRSRRRRRKKEPPSDPLSQK